MKFLIIIASLTLYKFYMLWFSVAQFDPQIYPAAGCLTLPTTLPAWAPGAALEYYNTGYNMMWIGCETQTIQFSKYLYHDRRECGGEDFPAVWSENFENLKYERT